jgi:hypothetical protein
MFFQNLHPKHVGDPFPCVISIVKVFIANWVVVMLLVYPKDNFGVVIHLDSQNGAAVCSLCSYFSVPI